ncbi:MAG TPA: T9SS type A sorting domain-containing protein [Bacteroidales bacterium]|nr:T9SS type A sorting domain-containing protein [Bacteroidales bacterium]
MKNTKLVWTILILCVTFNVAQAQNVWKHSYSLPYGSFCQYVAEAYDGGYVFGGYIRKSANSPFNGYIVKSDINGTKLWSKILDTGNDTYFLSFNRTLDNGFIAGGSYFNGISNDAYVMKFNVCGEPEWCCILPETDGDNSEIFGGIYQLPDSSYICKRYKIVGDQHNRHSLIKLHANGNVDWINYYDLNTSWMAQIDWRLILLSDTCFLVNGLVSDTIRPDGALSDMPLWYKVDKEGNLLWETKWELDETHTPSEARSTIEDQHGNYYSGGFISPWKNSVIFKLGHNGDTLSRVIFDDTIPGFLAGQINHMNYYNDTTLIVGSQFAAVVPSSNFWAINIVDTLGHRKNRHFEEERFVNVNSIVTSDNKILLLGQRLTDNGTFPYEWFSLYKFNMNLEYDSIYSALRTYDSLCPHPIASDTIPMPGICQYVNVPDPVPTGDVLQLKIYPNPATQYTTVEMPEYSLTATKGNIVKQQQFRPLKGEVQLSLMNLAGQIVKMDYFDASERNHIVNVSKLPAGMYVLHLTQKGKFIAQGKVMVMK